MIKPGYHFFDYSPCNGGSRASESVKNREKVLTLWASGMTKREISDKVGISASTVKKIVNRARTTGDHRGFAKTRNALSSTSASVLELHMVRQFVLGLAGKLDIHYNQAESMIRDIVAGIGKGLK
jgi:uncharacterized protein YerC